MRTRDDAQRLTWRALRERVQALAAGLAGLAVERGDTVAILLGNRPEFHVVDLAAMTLGATPFSIYETYAPNQIAFVVGDARARVAFVERAHLPAMLEARRSLPDLEHLILVDPVGDAPEGVLTLSEILDRGDGAFDLDAAIERVGAEDLATLIYTSGTTGPPKGVELTHGNLLAALGSLDEIIRFPPGTAWCRGCRPPTSPSAAPTTTCRSSSASPSPPARTRVRCSPAWPRCIRTGSSPCPASGRSSRQGWRRW